MCKKKLAEQREAVKNMDSLLILENSILSLKKDTAFLHRYRYVLYEIFILVLVLMMGLFIRNILLKSKKKRRGKAFFNFNTVYVGAHLLQDGVTRPYNVIYDLRATPHNIKKILCRIMT